MERPRGGFAKGGIEGLFLPLMVVKRAWGEGTHCLNTCLR